MPIFFFLLFIRNSIIFGSGYRLKLKTIRIYIKSDKHSSYGSASANYLYLFLSSTNILCKLMPLTFSKIIFKINYFLISPIQLCQTTHRRHYSSQCFTCTSRSRCGQRSRWWRRLVLFTCVFQFR